MRSDGKQARVKLEHGDAGRVSFSVKNPQDSEFDERLSVRVRDVQKIEDLKHKDDANYLIAQINSLEKDVCNADQDYQRRYYEMLKKNAERVGYKK